MITEENLKQKLHEIATMDLLELRQCWREEVGSEPFGKSAFFLRQRLAFKIQERLLGGHSDFICRKIREFAEMKIPREPTMVWSVEVLCRESGNRRNILYWSSKMVSCSTARNIALSAERLMRLPELNGAANFSGE